MFGRKPAPPPPPPPQPARPTGWSLTALTLDAVITGLFEPTDMGLMGHLNTTGAATVALNQAQIQTLHSTFILTQAAPTQIVVPKSTFVALVPRDEGGVRSASMSLPPRNERAVFYAGPYIIQGQCALLGEVTLRNFFGASQHTIFALTQIEITSNPPNPRFQPIQAQIALINKLQVQWYHAA